MTLHIDKDAESATVATESCATMDDDMIDADAHDALRSELLRALALGETPDDPESELSTRSLSQVQPFTTPAPDKATFEFAMATRMNAADIRERVSKLGLPVIEAGPQSFTWAIGAAGVNQDDWLSISYSDQKIAGSAAITSAGTSERRIATCDMKAAVARLEALLQKKDPSAVYIGPEGWNEE